MENRVFQQLCLPVLVAWDEWEPVLEPFVLEDIENTAAVALEDIENTAAAVLEDKIAVAVVVALVHNSVDMKFEIAENILVALDFVEYCVKNNPVGLVDFASVECSISLRID